jgi:hypothetical protein
LALDLEETPRVPLALPAAGTIRLKVERDTIDDAIGAHPFFEIEDNIIAEILNQWKLFSLVY